MKRSAFVFPSHPIFTRLDHFIWKLKNQDELVLNRTKNFFKTSDVFPINGMNKIVAV